MRPRSTSLLLGVGLVAALAPLAGCGGSGRSSAAVPVPVDQLALVTGGLPGGSALAGVTLLDAGMGVALINGSDALVVFDPVAGTAQPALPLPDHTFTAGLLDSAGNAASTTLSFPEAAAFAAGKLFVTSANLLPSPYPYNPGTVLVYDIAGGQLVVPPRVIELTLAGGQALYNPSPIAAYRDAAGAQRLAVVATGVYSFSAGATRSAVVIVDPVTEAIERRIELGATKLSAASAVASDRRLYVGGGESAAVFEVDLTTGATSTATLVTDSSTFNTVSAVALSHDEQTLFVANFNDASVTLLDRATLTPSARETAFRRNQNDRDANPFEANVQDLLVRPGVPGIDFGGAELLVATINLTVANNQPGPGIEACVDACDRFATGLPQAFLSAFFAPLTPGPGGDVQQLFQHPGLPGWLFVAEGATGVIHSVRFDDL